MTAEEIYLKLKEELTAENESSSSPERIFIKNDGQTICTIGMNRSHEIIFVEFKPSPKDLQSTEQQEFVHPHPVEMLHDAGWRQAQLTSWEEAEKLLEIIQRSYKKKRAKEEPKVVTRGSREARLSRIRAQRQVEEPRNKVQEKAKPGKAEKKKPAKEKKSAKAEKKPAPKLVVKAKPAPKPKAKSKPAKSAPKAAAKKPAKSKASKQKK